jgi:opacity protein-like surface antigen
MQTSKIIGALLLATTALSTGSAFAADMPEFVEPAPILVAQEFGGWYLRGDVGITNQQVDEFSSPIFDLPGNEFDLQYADFEASAFLGFGIGYKFNPWVRVDVTGEYRFQSDFRGLDYYTDAGLPSGIGANVYDGNKTEWLALANAYIDLPKLGIMTPFVGAGVGGARIKIADFTDFNPVVPFTATGISGDTSTWNFAWALYAGLAFEVSPQWTFEVGYRYLNLGDADTEDLTTLEGVSFQDNPYNFGSITSHDVKVGVRYQFN